MRYFKLDGHPYAQAHVTLDSEGVLSLISYTTTIIKAIPELDTTGQATGNYRLYCTGLYSRTTMKHISWFMNEYFIHGYYEIKPLAGTGDYLYSRLVKRMEA